GLKVLAHALDVLAADQRLDRLGPGRGRSQAALLHRLAELVVVDELPGRLHRGEQRRLGVARRRLRLLRLALRRQAADRLSLLDSRELAALAFLLLRSLRVRLESVDGAPARLERHLAARAEALVLDERHDRRPRIAGWRVEDGEEAARDEVEDAALVRRELADVVLDVGGNDRVVVVDARVVDDPAERELLQVEHVPRGGGVLGDREQRPRGRLELRDEVAREEARRGSRVGDRLLALVERLCGLERAARGEAEAAVRVALERGEVVEERRALGLLLALDRVDDAVLAGHALDDPVRAGSFLDPRLVA